MDQARPYPGLARAVAWAAFACILFVSTADAQERVDPTSDQLSELDRAEARLEDLADEIAFLQKARDRLLVEMEELRDARPETPREEWLAEVHVLRTRIESTVERIEDLQRDMRLLQSRIRQLRPRDIDERERLDRLEVRADHVRAELDEAYEVVEYANRALLDARRQVAAARPPAQREPSAVAGTPVDRPEALRARVHGLHVEVEAIRQRMERLLDRVDAVLQELGRVERELESP